jgi:hypothetical protein
MKDPHDALQSRWRNEETQLRQLQSEAQRRQAAMVDLGNVQFGRHFASL